MHKVVRTVARRVRFGVTNENIDGRFDSLVIEEVQMETQASSSSGPDDWLFRIPNQDVLLSRLYLTAQKREIAGKRR